MGERLEYRHPAPVYGFFLPVHPGGIFAKKVLPVNESYLTGKIYLAKIPIYSMTISARS
jgi:hypothetical protein